MKLKEDKPVFAVLELLIGLLTIIFWALRGAQFLSFLAGFLVIGLILCFVGAYRLARDE